MIVHGFVDQKHSKKEREKAKALRRSGWWKQILAEKRCFYCGGEFPADQLSMDHKVPVSRGGRSTKGNVVPSCKECNSKKKFYTPAEMIMQQADSVETPD